MQTSLETIGQLERRLNMAVPLVEIETEVERRLARLAKNVKVPGFRPGKVPLKMVAQQYGPQVRSEVISDRVQASFNDAIREQNVRVAGYPRIEPRVGGPAAPDQLEFSAVFEVYPEVRIGDLSAATIERPVAEVGPADVDKTIEVLRKQRTRYEQVTAACGERRPRDRRLLRPHRRRRVSRRAGEGFRRSSSAKAGCCPNSTRRSPGMRTGETKTFSLTFPSDYHGKEVAGKQAEFTLTVKAVAEAHLPDVDAEIREGIRHRERQHRRTQRGDRVESQARVEAQDRRQAEGPGACALRQKVELVVPKSLVEQEIAGDDAANGGRPAPAGDEGRGHQALARRCSAQAPRAASRWGWC